MVLKTVERGRNLMGLRPCLRGLCYWVVYLNARLVILWLLVVVPIAL